MVFGKTGIKKYFFYLSFQESFGVKNFSSHKSISLHNLNMPVTRVLYNNTRGIILYSSNNNYNKSFFLIFFSKPNYIIIIII